jgi:superfamily II DNA or RNA helicase
MIEQSLLLSCLDLIEEKEIKLLTWGDTSFYFNKNEIIELIKLKASSDWEEIFDELCEQSLIVEVKSAYTDNCYRSRMAESIYLYSNLRQWFHGKGLRSAKTLVSDYRFIRRPRQYPNRNISSSIAISQLSEELNLTDEYNKVLFSLLGGGGKSFNLSGFQVRATKRILDKYTKHMSNLKPNKPSGTIVCSGTGSGKTLSFYLPALTQLSQNICRDQSNRVQILAIYPRKELLKDQFNETFKQARLLDDYLLQNNKRKIKIGTYFGDTLDNRYLDGKVKFNAIEFDLLKCECSGKLKWLDDDRKLQKEILTCSRCENKIYEDEVALTRQSIAPDILFTTTEMLNQHLADSNNNKLFGVNTDAPIPLVLLDEVHTYEGTTGAQTSYLLKRWMKRSDNKPHFVGLSATLSDAAGFFSSLTGTAKHNIELIEPQPSEIIEEGAEYLLALRGDPVSQSALLSTTIQASMLTRRMLDSNSNKKPVSNGTFGTKTFVFTDDLDVNNRLFEMIADAEGWSHAFGKLTPESEPLAFLRSSKHPNYHSNKEQIQLLGQDWSNCEYIGHSTEDDDRADVARTSSQDSGVSESAEVIVATASLEVGYNDSKVGAVIQHKAPRGVASYLQRKGRAGRSRGMRPWMITVLSDYGRDRVAFHQYESLVDPEIKVNKLPVGNNHIQKMQASLAALEWLGKKIGKGSIWYYLRNPNQYATNKTYLDKLEKEVSSLLDCSSNQNSFTEYLTSALGINRLEVEKICWQPPRSLFMEFLPSLLQKLRTDWSVNGQKWLGVQSKGSPMPEFIPATLFSELILPSLDISLLRGNKDERTQEWQNMGFFQGLKEYAPGRISKRFTLNNRYETDWLVPENFEPTVGVNDAIRFEIDDAFGINRDFLKEITNRSGELLKIYQPRQILTKRLELKNVTETSNAFLNWQSIFEVNEDNHQLSPPANCDWERYLIKLCFFEHKHMQPVEVTRYTTGSNAQVKFKTKETSNITFNWQEQSAPVGIGTIQFVDGMRWSFQFSDDQLLSLGANESVINSLRFSYVQDSFLNASIFNNTFQANWVFECVTTTVMLLSVRNHLSIQDSIKYLSLKEGRELLQTIPLELFQLNVLSEDEDEEQALQRELISLLSDELIVDEIGKLLTPLYSELSGDSYISWLRVIMSNTLSGGINQLVSTVLPDVGDNDLNVDPVWTGDQLTIWLTENESGGVGIINRFENLYNSDPLNILNHFSRSFQAGDYEQVDFDIHQLLTKLEFDEILGAAFKSHRESKQFSERVKANTIINENLKKMGTILSHSFNSILHTRVLKAGSSNETDKDLKCWMDRWREIEADLKIEIPLNIASFLIAKEITPENNVTINKLKDKVIGQLWPRGNVVRQSSTQFYNRFIGGNNRTERLLVEQMISDNGEIIKYGENWIEELQQGIKAKGLIKLVVLPEHLSKLNKIILKINTIQIDQLGMFFHIRVNRIDRHFGEIILFVELAEVIQ